MTVRVINNATGTEVQHNHALTAVTGPHTGQCWRYRNVKETNNGHYVIMARRTAVGNVHREFHPNVFGLSVVIDITWRKRAIDRAQTARRKVDDYLLAGLFALIPLAAFEHFHFAERLFELFGHGGE